LGSEQGKPCFTDKETGMAITKQLASRKNSTTSANDAVSSDVIAKLAEGTKIAQSLTLLEFQHEASILELVNAKEWLPHKTRSAFTRISMHCLAPKACL
jgi:hypothetical protein